MDFIDGMTAVGMSLECATKIAANYIAQGDVDGLEDYVTALEAAHEVSTV